LQEGEISCFNFDETCYTFIRKPYLMEKIGIAIRDSLLKEEQPSASLGR
jgi:hypothetical protein